MSSSGDDDEREFSDSTDYGDYETTDDEFGFDMDDEDEDDDEDEEEEEEEEGSPLHFRECLRLLDAALAPSPMNSSVLPSWCGSGCLGVLEDPQILINGYRRTLALPLNKSEGRRLTVKAEPLEMKIDLVDGVSFEPSAHLLRAESFRLRNENWTSRVEPFLKRSCVERSLEIASNDFDLCVSQLILLDSSAFPRRFVWKKSQHDRSAIAKLFVTLPSTYRGGKETISHYKEKHTFDLADDDRRRATFFTVVPLTNECEHEIDLISSGSKLILVYDVVPTTLDACFNVKTTEPQLERVSRVLDFWLDGLEKNRHGYSTKIVLPFSDAFQTEKNPLVYPSDRLLGTILRRTIDEKQKKKFLLYHAVVQPNRSSDGTVHACRVLNQLHRVQPNDDDDDDETSSIFDVLDSCQGNCNETYSGNIFLRRTRSEQGNLIPTEQFLVPVWCLVPFDYRYELFLDHLPQLFRRVEKRTEEIFPLIDWLLQTPKKISFPWKTLLHQLVRLYSSSELHARLNETIAKIFHHRKFVEQFFPLTNKSEYDDVIVLLKKSFDPKIELHLHELFVEIFRRRSRDSERFRDAIKFIGVLATEGVNGSFVSALVHHLLPHIFNAHQSMPTITDLANLLALLGQLTDAYGPSCDLIVEQIIRQIKLSSTTTTNASLITNFLRTVLVPNLIQISRHYAGKHNASPLPNSAKRKRDTELDFPAWFVSLYQTCFACLTSYCQSPLPIPFYSNVSNLLHSCRCSLCQQLFAFLRNGTLFEQTFVLPHEHFAHFNAMTNKFEPLLIFTRSMTSDGESQQIHLMKMSKYDEELWRENNLLRSLLSYIPISNPSDEQLSDESRLKRFKRS